MKARHILGLAVLMAVAGSCKKHQNQDTNSFSASIEVDESRTYLNGMKVNWSAGDQIIVYGNGDSQTYTLSQGAGDQTATFTTTGGVQPANTYHAFYPSTSCTGVSGDVFTFTMPVTQTYTAGGFMNTLNPMAAKNDGTGGTTLGFRNAFAILNVSATGNNCAITSIELSTSGTNYQLSGTFTFDYANKTTALSSGTGNVITLTGISTNLTSSPQTFYFVVPPQALADGFTLTYKNGTSTVDTKSVTATQVSQNYTLAPNKMLNLTMSVEAQGIRNLLPDMVPANWYVSSGATLSAYNHGTIHGVCFSNSSSGEVFLRPGSSSAPGTAPLVNGHSYYVRFYLNMKDYAGTQTFDFYWPEMEGSARLPCNAIGTFFPDENPNNKWHMFSQKRENFRPGKDNGDWAPRIDFNGGISGTRECRAAGVMLIDLTEAGLTGLTKAQLDAKPYFYGITPTW